MSGFYLMHRGWQQNPVFGNDAFSRRDAWVWMIEQAQYQERRVGIGGKTVELNRGQFAHSLRYMALAWGWFEPSVRRFLTRLKTDAMIDASADAGRMVITICNYEKYQTIGFVTDADNDAASDARPTQDRRTTDANKKEGNKGNTETKSKTALGEVVDLEFEKFWQTYPRRVAKGQAVKAWRTSLKKTSASIIVTGAERYARESVGKDPTYLKHPATWLTGECWADEPSLLPAGAASAMRGRALL